MESLSECSRKQVALIIDRTFMRVTRGIRLFMPLIQVR